MRVTWSFAIDRGASNATFSAKAILSAMDRIRRYWAVDFVQVSRSPYMSFVLTNRVRNASWAAWTSGRTIYIPSTFRYNSYDQLVFVLVHEMGHVFGGSQHASGTVNVMSPTITDPLKNFTQTDYAWFRLPVRPATQVPRAWDEPNYWRMRMSINDIFKSESERNDHPLVCGHGTWWDWVRQAFDRPQREVIYELD